MPEKVTEKELQDKVDEVRARRLLTSRGEVKVVVRLSGTRVLLRKSE